MEKSAPAASPDAYVAALEGWQRRTVEDLRATVRRLTTEAVALNATLGDPTKAGK